MNRRNLLKLALGLPIVPAVAAVKRAPRDFGVRVGSVADKIAFNTRHGIMTYNPNDEMMCDPLRRRTFYIDTGNLPKAKADQYLTSNRWGWDILNPCSEITLGVEPVPIDPTKSSW